MFRNGPEVDGGGTAYLGPTTVIEMTIPMSQSSSNATLDDSWVLAGPITYDLFIVVFNKQWLTFSQHKQALRAPLKWLSLEQLQTPPRI